MSCDFMVYKMETLKDPLSGCKVANFIEWDGPHTLEDALQIAKRRAKKKQGRFVVMQRFADYGEIK